MKEFEKDYRKWSRVALISIVMFLFTIATIDAFLGFDFSKNTNREGCNDCSNQSWFCLP
jgi:hypothetical protein